MTTADYDDSQKIIYCPGCKMSIIVSELHEYVNDKPENKREAIEQEIEKWGLTYYDKAYYVEDIVYCPACAKISHLGDWLGEYHVFPFQIKASNLSSFLILPKSWSCLAYSILFLSSSIASFKLARPFSISPFLTFKRALWYKASA